MRRAARRDAVEPEVRAVVESVGGTWQPLNGEDIPDALVGFLGRTALWEVKTGNAPLRPGQEEWHRNWKGAPVIVVRSAAHARKALRMMAASPDLTDVLRAAHSDPEAA